MRKNLDQWQTYLESLDPAKIELGLEPVQTVYAALKLSLSSKIIVVAGTNGKGSTVSALQALLLFENKTVGSYVSPHLQKFNERICFQGNQAGDDELIDAFQRVEMARDTVQGDIALTYFEFTTLAAIQLLAQKNPDYLIFEVGLGGRLDAVNILDADIAIVTGVALDHTDWLGDNPESIGYEKAGVYRADKPAIYASSDCPDSVLKQINKINAKPYILGEQLSIDSLATDTLNGDAAYKIRIGEQTHSVNLYNQILPPASLLAAASAFVLLGFELTNQVSEVLANAPVRGRYQHLVFGHTECILDVAHNAQAATYLAEKMTQDQNLHKKAVNKPVAVVGTMSDKTLNEIFGPMVSIVSQWFLVQPDIPRASTLDQQRQVLIDLGVHHANIKDVGPITLGNIEDCLAETKAAVVFGSFYTVGEFLNIVDLQAHGLT